MNKTKKIVFIIIAIIAFAMLIAFYVINSFGKETTNQKIQIVQENINAPVSPIVQAIDPVIIKNSVIINGNKNYLLSTFQNPSKALTSVKQRDFEFLQLMKAKWNLDDLNLSNWREYKQKLLAFTASKLPDDLGGDKYEKQRQEFEGFLGIYQNDEINQETLEHINFLNFLISTKLFYQISLDSIIHNLPFDAPLVQASSN